MKSQLKMIEDRLIKHGALKQGLSKGLREGQIRIQADGVPQSEKRQAIRQQAFGKNGN